MKMIPVTEWMDTLAAVAILLMSLVGIAAVIANGLILSLLPA